MQPLPLVTQPLPGTLRSFDGQRRGFGDRGRRNGNVIVYPVPVYVGGYGYYGPDGTSYPVTPSSPTVIVVPSDQGSGYYQQPPDQYYGPSTFVPQEPAPPDPSSVTTLGPIAPSSSVTDQREQQNPLTLMVFKDHSIYAASDYWREGDRLCYVTNYGAKNSIALDQLDLDMTVQLNRERNVPFILVERQP